MTGLIFHPLIVCQYLEAQGLFKTVFERIVKRSAYFSTTLDRKIFILGLISFLKQKVIANNFDDFARTTLEFICYNLHIQLWEETRSRRKQLRGRLCPEIYPTIKSNRTGLHEMETQSIELYKYINDELKSLAGISTKNKDLSNLEDDDDMMNDSLDGDDPDSEILQAMISKSIKKEMNISQLQAITHVETKVDKVDEFSQFHSVMDQIKVTFETQLLRVDYHRKGRRDAVPRDPRSKEASPYSSRLQIQKSSRREQRGGASRDFPEEKKDRVTFQKSRRIKQSSQILN